MARRRLQDTYTMEEFAAVGVSDIAGMATGFLEELHKGAHELMLQSAIGLTPTRTGRMKGMWVDNPPKRGKSSVGNPHPAALVIDRGRSIFQRGPRKGAPSGSSQAPRGISRPTEDRIKAAFDKLVTDAERRSG